MNSFESELDDEGEVVVEEKQVRQDVLWKYLLRKFRRHVKHKYAINQFAKHGTEIQATNLPPSRKDREWHQIFCLELLRHKGMSLNEHVFLVFDALKLPAWLRTERNACGAFMLVHSHSITKRQRLLPQYQELFGSKYERLFQNFYQVFRETSGKNRAIFFEEPLVQYIWEDFVSTKPKELKQICLQTMPCNNNVIQE